MRFFTMKYFLAFLCLAAGGISLFFLGLAGLEIGRYVAWDQEVKALSVECKIEAMSEEQFGLKILYAFAVGENSFFGSTLLAKPYFFNEQAAEKAIKILSEQEWSVFFSKKNPQNNTVQKSFPYLLIVHASFCIGVCVYFFLLRACITKKSRLVYSLSKETALSPKKF